MQFDASAENPSDDTATSEQFTQILFRSDDVPELTGYIIDVETGQFSEGSGVSTAGGEQFGSPGGENDLLKIRPTSGTLVNTYWVVGDTGGDDISTDSDGRDDTRATLKSNFVRIVALQP